MKSRIERLIRIYNRLRRSPVTIEVIKKWCADVGIQISERQLYRDLNDIVNYVTFDKETVVVFEDEKNRKVWKIEFDKTQQSFSLWDINSFYLLKHFTPQTIALARNASLLKIEKILYAQLSKNKFEKLSVANNLFSSTNFFEYEHDGTEHQLLEEIIWAIQNQRKIIAHKNNHESTCLQKDYDFPVLLYPLSLVHHRGAIYISFYEPRTNDYFFLALYQIIKIELTNDTFNRNKLQKGLEQYQQTIFGVTGNIDSRIYKIKIETTKQVGESFLKYKYHSTQRVEFSKTGKTYLHLQCGINRELIGNLAMWFDHVKVIAPKKLQLLLLKKISDTQNVYNQSTTLVESNKAFINLGK